MRTTSLTALGGILTALSVFIMFLAGIIPNLTYVIPAICGVLLLIPVQEAELRWSVFIYTAVSLLSIFIVADKEAVVMYIFFFGYYPIVKKVYDDHLKLIPRILAKAATFNISIVLGYVLLIYVFLIPVEGLTRWGNWTIAILLGLGNVVFWIYDWLLNSLNRIYLNKYRDRFHSIFRA